MKHRVLNIVLAVIFVPIGVAGICGLVWSAISSNSESAASSAPVPQQAFVAPPPPRPALDIEVRRNAAYLRVCAHVDLHNCTVAHGSPDGRRLSASVPLIRSVESQYARWAQVRGPGSGANVEPGCAGQQTLVQRLCTFDTDHRFSDDEFADCVAQRGMIRFERMTATGAAAYGDVSVDCTEGVLNGRLEAR